MTWATGVMLAWGAVSLVLGYRVRTGKSRTFYPSYRTTVMWRNAPFTYIPWGIWLIAGAGAIIASKAHSGVAVAVLTLVAFPAMIVGFVWLFKPPEFMKPRWLRQVESGAAPEPDQPGIYGAPSPSGARRMYLPAPVYWGGWVVTALVFVLWFVLDWPPSVLVGEGGAISLMAAHTPKKRSVDQGSRRPWMPRGAEPRFPTTRKRPS